MAHDEFIVQSCKLWAFRLCLVFICRFFSSNTEPVKSKRSPAAIMNKNVNQKIITLGGTEFLIINLTEPLREDIEVFPGDPKPKKRIFSDICKTGYQHHIYSIGDHSFHPHGDAPNHQNPDQKSKGFEYFNLDYHFNSACLIDLSEHNQANEIDGIRYIVKIQKDHLKPYEKIISDKGAIIIRTGYDQWLIANKKHTPDNIPYLSKKAADYLSEFKKLKVIGIDSLTVDRIGSHYVHQKFKNKLIVEALVNLNLIPIGHRDNFDLQTSTIAIIGATGGPVAAFAYI